MDLAWRFGDWLTVYFFTMTNTFRRISSREDANLTGIFILQFPDDDFDFALDSESSKPSAANARRGKRVITLSFAVSWRLSYGTERGKRKEPRICNHPRLRRGVACSRSCLICPIVLRTRFPRCKISRISEMALTILRGREGWLLAIDRSLVFREIQMVDAE